MAQPEAGRAVMPLVMVAVVVARDNSEPPEMGERPAPLVEHAVVTVRIGELGLRRAPLKLVLRHHGPQPQMAPISEATMGEIAGLLVSSAGSSAATTVPTGLVVLAVGPILCFFGVDCSASVGFSWVSRWPRCSPTCWALIL